MTLDEKLTSLPPSPGVYLMKDSLGHIIYVGKSKNLKNRVRSYFQNAKDHSPKVKKLVNNIKDIELLLTDTEFEALLLECKLVQELKPRYNKKMKNPSSYAYIGILGDEGFRRIEITTSPIENKDNLYFGPYTSRKTAERAIQGIKECYKIMCSNAASKNTPCLNHSLGLCIGICMGGSALEAYQLILKRFIGLLSGTDVSILEDLQQKMLDASTKFEFEAAAKYRDSIDAILGLLHKEKVIEFTVENKNLAVIESLNAFTIKLFLIQNNRILFDERYDLKRSSMEQVRIKIKSRILDYLSPKTPHSSMEVSQFDIDEAQIIYRFLSLSSTRYLIVSEEWLESDSTNQLDEALHALVESLEKHPGQ